MVLQSVEVGEVGYVRQGQHTDIDFVGRCSFIFGCKSHRVFLFNVDVGCHRYDSEHGHTADAFQYLSATFKKAEVSSKFVDDNSLYPLAVFRWLEHDRAVGACKDTATVNIRNKNHLSPGIARHGHVYYVAVSQIDFGNTSRALNYNGIIYSLKSGESCVGYPAEIFATLCPEIRISVAVATWLAVDHHL